MDRSIYSQWFLDPMKKFMSNSSASGIILFSSAVLAIILSNSPLADWFHSIWKIKVAFSFGNFNLSKDLHHWINDGLMAIFFFVVGLELKREIIAGELSQPRNAILPLTAALGGMFFPAVIYLAFNGTSSVTADGWGIPMATDIAFALGILYLLGNKVPLSLKIFLTALAIADDLGAVLVIAFFYTSDINFVSLATGAVFLIVLVIGNIMGVRNTLFYGLIGIGGLWLAFLMSGVHATIAAVLAAFTIPARVEVSENMFTKRMQVLLDKFRKAKITEKSTLTPEQLTVMSKIKILTDKATTPLQKLEHAQHGLVSFFILPVFALANAGVTITADTLADLLNPVTLGVSVGLFAGKLIGVAGLSLLLVKLKVVSMPAETNKYHIIGAGFLAGIGFTMSLFITELAFSEEYLVEQAKVGILFTSALSASIGYMIIKYAGSKKNV